MRPSVCAVPRARAPHLQHEVQEPLVEVGAAQVVVVAVEGAAGPLVAQADVRGAAAHVQHDGRPAGRQRVRRQRRLALLQQQHHLQPGQLACARNNNCASHTENCCQATTHRHDEYVVTSRMICQSNTPFLYSVRLFVKSGDFKTGRNWEKSEKYR